MTKEIISNFIKGIESRFYESSVKILNNNFNYSTIITNFDVENLDKHVSKLILIYQAIKFKQTILFEYNNVQNETI